MSSLRNFGQDQSSSDENEEEILSFSEDDSVNDDRRSFSDGHLSPSQTSDRDETEDFDLNTDAWGRKKSLYFNTDFVDEDRGRTYREEDKELAEAEESSALEIQRKYLQNVHSSVFETSLFSKKEDTSMGKVAVPEWKSISKPEKLKALKKKWPQLLSLLGDFRMKISSLKKQVQSSLKTSSDGSQTTLDMELSRIFTQLHFHYLMNLSFYMHLKNSERIASDFVILEKIESMKKLLTLCDELQKMSLVYCDKQKKMGSKRSRTSSKGALLHAENTSDNKKMSETSGMEETKEKRSVTYKIVKNKGIVPYRRKEFRNPRVRQKIRYRKAEIRRKGQVKKPTKEISRYGGEVSGIHAHVKRSVKLK